MLNKKMLVLYCLFIFSAALDVKLGQNFILKDSEFHNKWSSSFNSAKSCLPEQGFYFTSQNDLETITISNFVQIYVPITLRISSKNIEVKLSVQDLELFMNMTKEITLKYQCSSQGWHEINLIIETNGKIYHANWMKYCGESHSFDLSFFLLVVISVSIVSITAFLTKHNLCETEDEKKSEVLTISLIAGFLLISSGIVVGLYYYEEYFGLITQILYYFLAFAAISKAVQELANRGICKRGIVVPMIGEVTISTIFAGFLAISTIFGYVFIKNWILGDCIGLCVAYFIIKTVKILRFQVALALLALFFCYDLFWRYCSSYLFGENVISAVSSSIVLPVKLQIPYFFNSFPPNFCSDLLIIDDLAVPGLFLAFIFKYDRINRSKSSFLLVAIYGFSLIVNIFVIGFFRLEQPAILVISPLMILGILLYAHRQQETIKLFKELKLEKSSTEEFQLEDLINKPN